MTVLAGDRRSRQVSVATPADDVCRRPEEFLVQRMEVKGNGILF